VDFTWNEAAQHAFNALKQAFTTAPILAHVNPNEQFTLETDASDFALGAVLSQVQKDNQLHPVAFYSRKFTPAEINYDVYDKELLAIVASFGEWRHYLEGSQHKILVYCDHKNLQHFTTTRTLNRRQARWSLHLSSFDFTIVFRPGKLQGKPDALSRRSEYQPKGGDEAVQQQKTALIKPEQLNALLPDGKTFQEQLKENLNKDELAQEIFKFLNNPTTYTTTRLDQDLFQQQNGLLYYNNCLYIPDLLTKLKVLHDHHDSLAAGHFGFRKTLKAIKQQYWWPNQFKFIKEYVQSCDTCARAKSTHHKPYGLLQPLPIPQGS
jgi:hypothetical protein